MACKTATDLLLSAKPQSSATKAMESNLQLTGDEDLQEANLNSKINHLVIADMKKSKCSEKRLLMLL